MSALSEETSVPPQVLLEHHLKSLKLPSFAREYEKVAAECAREQIDYPRYLLRLCELERIDRDRRNMERRIPAGKVSTNQESGQFRLQGHSQPQ